MLSFVISRRKPPFESANAGKRWIYVYPISSVSALSLRFSLWIRLEYEKCLGKMDWT